MFEGKNNEIPFTANDLESTGLKGKYFEVKNLKQDPDLVVKEGKTKWGFFEQKGVHPLNDIDRVKEDLDILEQDFGEFLPETNLVVGKNKKGEDTIYIVQHKIRGEPLKEAESVEQIREELRGFFRSVIDSCKKHLVYYGNSKSPSIIFPDMKGWNFIFGVDAKKKEEQEKLYFVDTYPIEGSEFNSNFVDVYIATIVKPTFPQKYWPIVDEFAHQISRELQTYIKSNSSEIPRVG